MEVKETALNYNYTYRDYENRGDDERFEIIDGVIYMMSPPSRVHQEICGEIYRQLANFVRGKPCKAYIAPFGVRLHAAARKDTVVEPDIVVVCDKSKLDDKGCNGAPDMVVEILSPSTAGKDRVIKFNKYLQAGVREYWIIDPDSKTLGVHVLKNGEYVTTAYGDEDTVPVPVHVLDGCTVDMKAVFEY